MQRKSAETESEGEAGADRADIKTGELQSQSMCGAAMGQKEVSHSPAAD